MRPLHLALLLVTAVYVATANDMDDTANLAAEYKETAAMISQLKTKMSRIKDSIKGNLRAEKSLTFNNLHALLGEATVPENKAKCACPTTGTCNQNQNVVRKHHNCFAPFPQLVILIPFSFCIAAEGNTQLRRLPARFRGCSKITKYR